MHSLVEKNVLGALAEPPDAVPLVGDVAAVDHHVAPDAGLEPRALPARGKGAQT